MYNELSIYERSGQLYTDSREVALMVGKRHTDLLRSIHRYEDVIRKDSQRKIASADFFKEANYIDEQGKPRLYYLVTRKGCDMIAHKMTGDKGIWFTAAYIDRFYAYEQALRERQSADWKLARLEGKRARRLETDAIKMFVSYAEAQGSQHAEKYYIGFTKMANEAVGIGAGERDGVSASELLDLRPIENVIDRAILGEIASGAEYHQAFRNVKVKVLQVAALALSVGCALPQKSA